ncbi:rRNA methyltransferase 2, mitochondrial isoform X2 [Thrips palmi]|uniref:rRNA methyltransferase 2, mitochondrial n=1 Tax=Thrips palmi TaxID=161013 RepID=A0A6P8ZTL9_THRPL|nr:rRNA methyltransferase 2, mitochondrial isoform X2 [Thrips palmi]
MSKILRNTCRTLFKETPTNLKGRKKSSQEWLTRQLKDPYVEKSRLENYRSRSAFKLIEIDDKFKFLRPGNIIIDCGASPGGWTQVAAQRCNADGKDTNSDIGTVVGIDLIRIHPIPGTILLSPMDFTKVSTQEKIQQCLNGKPVDVLMSDMAPNATGVAVLDHERIIDLVVQALRFALQVSRPGGSFLAKIWNGAQMQNLMNELERFYQTVHIVKPPASRKDSAEIYFYCQGFKGLKARPSQ